MKTLISTLLVVLITTIFVSSQNVAINTSGAIADPSSMLDVSSSTTGILVPRVVLTATNVAAPVTAPLNSLLVYNTNTAGAGTTAVTPGYYYWDNAASVWRRFMQANEGWLTGGNLGTTAGTNFAGTGDNVSFDVRTNNVIRTRFLNTGEVVANNTTVWAGDVFSVYAQNTANGSTGSINNTAGLYAINGYAPTGGFGVYGNTNGVNNMSGAAVVGEFTGTTTANLFTSQGVWGLNNTSPAGALSITMGVRGDATGTPGAGVTMGVFGINGATTGAGHGVYGQAGSPTGFAVVGINTNNTAVASHGIQGQSSGSGGAAGVRGINTAPALGAGTSGYGVRGSCATAPSGTGFSIGVAGTTTGGSGTTYGLFGSVSSNTGFATYAINTTATGTGMLALGNNITIGTYIGAGSGIATNGTGEGIFALGTTAASGIGVIGVGNNLTGSIFAPVTGGGVVGTGSQYGVIGFATTTVNTDPLGNNAANGPNGSSGGYFEVQIAGAAQTWSYVAVRDNGGVLRKIIGTGTVNTIVKDLDEKYVALSCPEAPENLFQDYGHGQLVNGFAHIDIDPILAKNIIVNDKHPLRVFVQLEGDCQGVFVINKTGVGFDVKELNGGTSNVEFTYTIVANRADEVLPDGSISKYSDERFPDAPGPIEKQILTTEKSLDNEYVNKLMQDEPVDAVKTEIPNTIRKK